MVHSSSGDNSSLEHDSRCSFIFGSSRYICEGDRIMNNILEGFKSIGSWVFIIAFATAFAWVGPIIFMGAVIFLLKGL